MVLLLILAVTAKAEPAWSAENEAALLERINEARRDPMGTAVAMGIDVEVVLQTSPELRPIMEQGLPPLSANAALERAAVRHAEDMLANGYYDTQSLDGRMVQDRVVAEGYITSEAGESLGMIGFGNFLDPADAVEAIFENLFRDELREGGGNRCILNPDFDEIGVNLGAGIYTAADGSLRNVYLAVVDYGASAVDIVERALARLINEVRKYPKKALAEIGIDEEDGKAALGENGWVLNGWLPPLAWNQQLSEAAKNHLEDMMQEGYYGHFSESGKGPAEKVEVQGYVAESIGEAMSWVFVEQYEANPFEIARVLVFELLRKEYLDRKFFIMSREFSEFGLSVRSSTFADEGSDYRSYMVVIDFGRPVESLRYFVGVIYADSGVETQAETNLGPPERLETYAPVIGYGNLIPVDPDRGFDLKEGVQGYSVSLYRWFDGAKVFGGTLTGVIGQYQIPFYENGWYELIVEKSVGQEMIGSWIVYEGEENYLKDLDIEK